MGEVYSQMGDYQQAIYCYTDAHEGYEEEFGPNDPSTLHVLTNLAYNYQQNNQPVKALILYTKAKEGYENSDDAVETLVGMASCHEHGEDYEAALSYFEQAHEIYKRLYGEETREAIQTLTSVGVMNKQLERWNEALGCFERAKKLEKLFADKKYYNNDIEECKERIGILKKGLG